MNQGTNHYCYDEFICTYNTCTYMLAFLVQLTYMLTKLISTILRQRKAGKIGNESGGHNRGIMRMHVSCQKCFTCK